MPSRSTTQWVCVTVVVVALIAAVTLWVVKGDLDATQGLTFLGGLLTLFGGGGIALAAAKTTTTNNAQAVETHAKATALQAQQAPPYDH